METSDQNIQPNQELSITGLNPSSQVPQNVSQPQATMAPRSNYIFLWISLVLIFGFVTLWWIWGQLNFVVVNKTHSNENFLHIRYLKLSRDGYLAVKNSNGGLPFEQIGQSEVIKKNLYTNTWVELYEKGDPSLSPVNILPGDRFYLRIYHDTNNDNVPNSEYDTMIREITVDL